MPNVRFWLRLSKKPRHIGGVKLWNHGGAVFDSFFPSAVIKRTNLSVLSGRNTSSTASAISGLFGTVPRTSASPPKADIRIWMSAVVLIAYALTPEPDIRGGHRPPSNSRPAAAIIALPSASRSSALSSVSSSRAGGLLLAMEAYTQKFSKFPKE